MPGQHKKVNTDVIKAQDASGNRTQMYNLMDELIAAYHSELAMANIVLAWNVAMKPDRDGNIPLGKVRKASELDRKLHGFDVVVEINKEHWDDPATTINNRRAILDRLLCEARPVLDEDNVPKEDEDGKIVYYCRKAPIQEYPEVIERHGIYHPKLRTLAELLKRKLEEEERPPAANPQTP